MAGPGKAMSLIFTPGQLRQRSEFYYQLAQLTSAGLGLIQALEQLERNPPALSYRRPIRQILKSLAQGCTFTDAVRQLGIWLPSFDVALIGAGEHSGRLDTCFRLLSDYYADRTRMAQQMIGSLAYPVFLFHFMVFIFPFPEFFRTGDTKVFLAKTFGILIPIYGVVLLAIYAAQSRHGEKWRSMMESILNPVPVLGTARRYLALGRLSAALEALLSAGVTIIEAWELAATACGSPELHRTVLAWKPLVNAGQTPAETVRASRRFPEMFANQYAAGEISGRLDDTLKRLHKYYQEEGTRKLQAVAQWTPRFVYLVVMLVIAYRVIQFWTGYFQQISGAGGF
jgi:type II secretory pathway component PulF